MLRVYISIHNEFIRNLDGILQNDFPLKLSFEKTKYIFEQSISDVKVILMIGFQIIYKALCGIWNLCMQGETLSFRFI